MDRDKVNEVISKLNWLLHNIRGDLEFIEDQLRVIERELDDGTDDGTTTDTDSTVDESGRSAEENS